jgi:phosphate transport system substrate-binding protein
LLTVLLLVGGGLAALIYYSPAFFAGEGKPSSAQLKTGGTSVVSLMFDNGWRREYSKAKGVEIDYESTGSTKGIDGMIERRYAIAFTHAPLSDEQRKKAQDEGGEVLQIPISLCAVVPLYNLPQLKDKPPLKFTGAVLADIFLGKITRWNDPALARLNDGVTLPDTDIVVVHREDSSGTTLIFTGYLHETSEAWRQAVGRPANELKWPVGVGKARSHGVALHVRLTEGAIGYVDLAYAQGPHAGQFGAVQNKDATAFIHAEPRYMTAALKEQLDKVPGDLTFRLTNQPGADSYPISGGIWAVCYQNQPAATQQQVADFLSWATHKGQKIATLLSYAPLPPELVQRVDEKVKLIKAAK